MMMEEEKEVVNGEKGKHGAWIKIWRKKLLKIENSFWVDGGFDNLDLVD